MKCFMTNQSCIYESEFRFPQKIESKEEGAIQTFFLISPFGYPYDDFYEKVFKKLNLENKYRVVRADRAVQLGFVMCQKICREIRKADYIIVDLTDDNPNVYYELGLAFGFGKRIIFVSGEVEHIPNSPNEIWKRFLANRNRCVISYYEIISMFKRTDNIDEVADFLKRCSFNSGRLTDDLRHPQSYINPPTAKAYGNRLVLFCLDTPMSDKKILLDSAGDIIIGRGWKLRQRDIYHDFELNAVINELAPCKICMIDITHYYDEINPHSYWILGLAHALSRETIPITNKARSGDFVPFDVRGLYQIYFNQLKSFEDSLNEILGVISKEYENEIKEYPQRYIWDRIIKNNPGIEVCTFGRGNKEDPKRDGGRTNVDTWDYQAVARLSFFLAQKYKNTTVVIKPPEDRRAGIAPDEQHEREFIIKNTFGQSKNFIVIGSPDVSDYAEIVLATAYGVEPYKQLECIHANTTCNSCEKQCVGKRGYIFYKSNYFDPTKQDLDQSYHPRANSFCYRDAKSVDDQFVLWYGQHYPCRAEVTYGVITIFYKNPFSNINDGSGSVVVLSGFTGIATFGLALLLAPREEDETETMRLHEVLQKFSNEEVVQILVEISYKNKQQQETVYHDIREKPTVTIKDVQPIVKK